MQPCVVCALVESESDPSGLSADRENQKEIWKDEYDELVCEMLLKVSCTKTVSYFLTFSPGR